MNAYRVRLTLRAPLGTPMISGTLWGHLAWAVRYLRGGKGLVSWLDRQKKEPWLISSVMPYGMLPRPLLRERRREARNQSLAEMQQVKRARKVAWIPEAVFCKLRDGLSAEALSREMVVFMESQKAGAAQGLVEETLRPHNRINRCSGTTPEAGGLHFEEVVSPGLNEDWQIFVAAPKLCGDELDELFRFVGTQGFGANASTGNGGFEVQVEETDLFATAGPRAMSLSHGVLVKEAMVDARYKQHVHFGKLGGDFAKGAYSPFKYPILMAQPGATFTPRGEGPFGRILEGVHHDPKLRQVCHYAVHLPLFFTEVEG